MLCLELAHRWEKGLQHCGLPAALLREGLSDCRIVVEGGHIFVLR